MKKVIAYLSVYKPEALLKSYQCPSGANVDGIQTNDAPVRYLLREYPDVSEILCIVTEQAESTWENLQQTIGHEYPQVRFRKIPILPDEEFSAGPLTKVLETVGSGTEILLDTTGGLRDAVIHLMLVSRALSYIGVKTVGAVYSNYYKSIVTDVLSTYRLFDLIGGMQELSSFGSAKTLRQYFAADCEPAVTELLASMDDLKETIALCRTKLLEAKIERFNGAMDKASACEDPLLRALLPAFQKKFGKKLTTPGTIKWCADSDMLQQALTIYTERIPAYVFGHEKEGQKCLLETTKDIKPSTAKDYEDPDAVRFYKEFLQISSTVTPDATLKRYVRDYAPAIVQQANGKKVAVPPEIATGVRNLALLCNIAYFDNGGTFDYQWGSKLPPEKQELSALAKQLNNNPAPNVYLMMSRVSCYPVELVNILLERKDSGTPSSPTANSIRTIEHLEELLPQSEYRLHCPVSQMQGIMRDYLYIKALRNLANHANDEGTGEQSELMAYLCKHGYQALEQTSADDVRQAILGALERLKPNGKEMHS